MNKKLILELEKYIEENLYLAGFKLTNSYMKEASISPVIKEKEIDDFIDENRKPLFSQYLFKLIDERGLEDVEVYKKARIDRRHFSKIRSNPDYNVGKNTAISLALALELDIDETNNLLETCGFTLSDSNVFDLVIQFFIEKKIYDLNLINEALYYFKLKPLIL